MLLFLFALDPSHSTSVVVLRDGGPLNMACSGQFYKRKEECVIRPIVTQILRFDFPSKLQI